MQRAIENLIENCIQVAIGKPGLRAWSEVSATGDKDLNYNLAFLLKTKGQVVIIAQMNWELFSSVYVGHAIFWSLRNHCFCMRFTCIVLNSVMTLHPFSEYTQ